MRFQVSGTDFDTRESDRAKRVASIYDNRTANIGIFVPYTISYALKMLRPET